MNEGEYLKRIKIALLGETGYIRLGKHSNERIKERGYYVGDIIECLNTGNVIEIETGFNNFLKKECTNITVEGFDKDGNPIVIIFSEESEYSYSVVTIIPPTDKNRFSRLI